MSENTLLLNADARPVSYLPLSTISWQDAVKYLVLDKVVVLHWYEDWTVRSTSWETSVPAVVMLKEYFKKRPYVRLSSRNVFLRDRYSCQYCGCRVTDSTGTLDHVYPSSLGGVHSWDNLVTACKVCNNRKGSSTGKYRPHTSPYKPTYWELSERRREIGYNIRHASWDTYLNG